MHELDQNLQILASILPRMRMMEKIVKYEAGAGDWRNTTGTSYLECLVVHDQNFLIHDC